MPSAEYYFPYTDHLGSIVAITNTNSAIVAEQNFDAWGRKRNVTTWDYANVQSVPDWLYRGYTGHEHLAEFGLINMNARLYDPVLGRMLSPDNYVNEYFGSQALNRYSYADNNPLKYTDPSGNFIPLLVVGAALIGGGLNLWNNWDKVKEGGFWSGVNYFGIGAVGGVASLTNPLAGAALVAGGNTLTDIVTPNFKFPNDPVDIFKYFGKKALDGLAASGSGQLAKGALSYFWKDSWRMFGAQTGKMTTELVLPTFERVATKVPVSSIAATGANSVAKNLLKIEQKSLQHMFSKHAKDFGINGNWNKTMANEFEGILNTHVERLTPMEGTWRGAQQALHYYNPATGLNISTDVSGKLLGGWKLSTEQILNLFRNGNIQ